jgi:hypothetical protein
VEVLILKEKNKINILLKASVLAFILIFTSCTNISTASFPISNCKEAVNYAVEQLSIDKDKVLIYVWGPVNKGEEIFSTKEHIMDAPEKGFIIYIDLYPQANLFHPVQYVFLSESTKELLVFDAYSPPRNFKDYHMADTAFAKLFKSAENRRAPIPRGIAPAPSTSSDDNRWAVLMNGGYDSGNNHVRYWNDLSNIYITLNYVYEIPDENIIVLCSDGLNPAVDQSNGQNSNPDLDGDGDDDIMYSCILSNVDMVFTSLANNFTANDKLFVFTTDHGSSVSGWNVVENLWNYEELTDAHFASLLAAFPDCEKICTLEPCFSGGFLDNVVVPPGPVVASSACRYDEYSWATNDLLYDEYVFHWTAAMKGEDAFGTPVNADSNGDGVITLDEAYNYAKAHDVASESPQYGDYPEGIGETISLWISSEPPETPTKPYGPEEWIQYVEATFSTSAIEPEGEDVYYMFDWGDGNLSEWIGPYPSGKTVEASHVWNELGEYEVKAIAKDIHGVKSSWSPAAPLTIVEDQAPIKPGITGKQRIVGGLNYNYTFVSTDPESHDIYYKIDWDDGHVTDWLGPYSSGESINLGHKWLQKGDYTIKAWAKDIFEKVSGQSNYMVKVLFVINSNPSNNQMMLNILQSLQQKATNS